MLKLNPAFSANDADSNIPGSAGTSSNSETNPAVLNDSPAGTYTAAYGYDYVLR